MNNATRFTVYALAFNIIILVPVVIVLLFGLSPAEKAFGPLTEGRLILTSIYIAIALVSALLIGLHQRRMDWAMPMSVALFSVQITYKLITVATVGLSNPVVITNLIVVLVQAVVLFTIWQAYLPRKAAA